MNKTSIKIAYLITLVCFGGDLKRFQRVLAPSLFLYISFER